MTTQHIAERLIELCKEGEFLTAQKELYHDHTLSIDPDGSRTTGRQNMHIKEKRFLAGVEKMNRIDYSEILFAGDYFTVVLSMEIEFKKIGMKSLEEVCVYHVRDGKITFEQFFRNL